MFGYELLRNQWVMLVLFGGTAVVLFFILQYLDYYIPRKKKEEGCGEYQTGYLGTWQAFPWSLRILIIVILIFGIIFSIDAVLHSKSW